MDLDKVSVANILRKKGVKYLFHANTVITSCSFLKSGGLLSRGAIEARGLGQTKQYTDPADQRFGVWSDIWLDGVDIHSRAKARNSYGPVLFVYEVDVLADSNLPQIRVTKTHPQNWNGLSLGERYFLSIEQMEEQYEPTQFTHSLTIPNFLEPLGFRFLNRIIVDNPSRTVDGDDVYRIAINTLKIAADQGGLIDPPLVERHANSSRYSHICGCWGQYSSMQESSIRTIFSAVET